MLSLTFVFMVFSLIWIFSIISDLMVFPLGLATTSETMAGCSGLSDIPIPPWFPCVQDFLFCIRKS